jgi:cytochrome c biogenesis protein CcmG, thiol:disulfide interchange protein DsbE
VLDLGVAQGDGPAVPLRTVVGERPTIVAFWASYCVACRAEVPALNRAADRWSARGLRIVGVSLESNPERVSAARTAWGIRYDVFRLASENDALIERLFPRGLPVAAFVRDGRTTLHEQLLDDAELARLVPALLGHGRPAK